METNQIITWLQSAPQLDGDLLNWNYLPSYSGWSLTIPKSETRTDILGNTRTIWQLKITRRLTVQSNADRLAVVTALENLAVWAAQNPPAGTRARVTSLPEFTSRNTSGIEDISITLTLQEG